MIGFIHMDKHNVNSSIMCIIMNKLHNTELKSKFLSYLIANKNVVLNKVEILGYIKKELLWIILKLDVMIKKYYILLNVNI